MKKNYIIPNVKAVEVDIEDIIADSGINDIGGEGDGEDVKAVQSFGSNRNIWDNEW